MKLRVASVRNGNQDKNAPGCSWWGGLKTTVGKTPVSNTGVEVNPHA